ncbi:MAG: tryptophan synthase subunit alpha [Pseudomonadota bacterium]
MKGLRVGEPTKNRIERRFAELAAVERTAFVAFITAGDPDFETSKEILFGLPGAGADMIELGMPFSDPMADGPAIQASSLRALKAGQTMDKTLAMVQEFRKRDTDTPVILMGYYNPIYIYGTERFVTQAVGAGADGIIVVDVPPEADDELCIPAIDQGLCFIRLATPTTDDQRLPSVLQNTRGFVYYVSITGITGSTAADAENVRTHITRIREASALPVGVGFGIKTPEQVAAMSKYADAVIVGSALVTEIAQTLDLTDNATGQTVPSVLHLVAKLSAPLKS